METLHGRSVLKLYRSTVPENHIMKVSQVMYMHDCTMHKSIARTCYIDPQCECPETE